PTAVRAWRPRAGRRGRRSRRPRRGGRAPGGRSCRIAPGEPDPEAAPAAGVPGVDADPVVADADAGPLQDPFAPVRLRQDLSLLRKPVRADEGQARLPDDLDRRIAEELFGQPVPAGETPLERFGGKGPTGSAPAAGAGGEGRRPRWEGRRGFFRASGTPVLSGHAVWALPESRRSIVAAPAGVAHWNL